MKKIEGIIISDERHNELLEKERKADSNVISLFLPTVITNIEYHGCSRYESTTMKVSELYLEGEFENKETIVEHIKSKLDGILKAVERKRDEAEWRIKEQEAKDKKYAESVENGKKLSQKVKEMSEQLAHYSAIKNKWWYKLFTATII